MTKLEKAKSKNWDIVIWFIVAFSLTFFLLNRRITRADKTFKFEKVLSLNGADRITLLSNSEENLSSFLNPNNQIKYKIVIVFDAGCSICYETLKRWKKYMEDNNLNKQDILFIGYDIERVGLEYVSSEVLKDKYYMFLDSSFEFGKANNLKTGPPQSFLIDIKQKKLLLVNTIENENLSDYLIKEVKK